MIGLGVTRSFMVLLVHGFTVIVSHALRFRELIVDTFGRGMGSLGLLGMSISVSSGSDSDSSSQFHLLLGYQFSTESGGFLTSSNSSELASGVVSGMETSDDLVLFDEVEVFATVGLQNGSLGSHQDSHSSGDSFLSDSPVLSSVAEDSSGLSDSSISGLSVFDPHSEDGESSFVGLHGSEASIDLLLALS